MTDTTILHFIMREKKGACSQSVNHDLKLDWEVPSCDYDFEYFLQSLKLESKIWSVGQAPMNVIILLLWCVNTHCLNPSKSRDFSRKSCDYLMSINQVRFE